MQILTDFFARPGFEHKLGKIYSETNSSYRVPGLHGRFSENDVFLFRVKSPPDAIRGGQQASLLKNNTAARQFASFIGLCRAALKAVRVARLHLRNLQRVLVKYLKPGSSKKSDYFPMERGRSCCGG